MKNNYGRLFAILLLILSGTACEKVFYGEVDPYVKEFVLFAEYEYADTITGPKITIDREKSSPEIQIGSQSNIQASLSGNRIVLPIENVKFQDERGVYQVIGEITTEEKNPLSGKWETDVENFLNYSKTKDLTIILVLDVSSSLGNDVDLVKEYAANFISLMLNDRDPGAVTQFGVVGFAENTSLLNVTTDANAVTQFIRGLQENQNATKLYQAMNDGVTLAENAPPTDGYFIITFTDGRNNAWDNVNFEDPNSVDERIDNSGIDLFSYTIGLNGKSENGVDDDALGILASTLPSGTPASTIIESASELKPIFEKIAKSIAADYELRYDRNKSFIRTPRPLRFRIKCQLF